MLVDKMSLKLELLLEFLNGEISNDSLTIKNVKIKNFQFKQKCSSFEGLWCR